ncbi:MAG: hypothetical protein AVDCRST_MAG49-2025 [uncultured Thermomicrobiales bacterium]|uniref:DUF1835 domain-containing protein n=1 Tax=uncultured Thermomicrobiales bacterium TaxID=1645740 RepID=A0A6J4UML5_9BACT|nr:MAG: hypothetical protein AVDCRST_MAG49-2025 [uncultured Thermomicrobiales bacterium]
MPMQRPTLPDPNDPDLEKTLHVANGDVVADLLAETDIRGEVLVWRDVLSEGPVPPDLSLVNLGAARARFLDERGWMPYLAARADLAKRDSILSFVPRLRDELVLWFEHDLHDQLQLIQILDRFGARGPEKLRISLVTADRYPGIEPFHGLGQLDADQLSGLFPTRSEIGMDHCRLARRAWQAFRASDPTEIERFLGEDTSALPFLAPALRRHLAQFPAADTGLSMTETLTLRVLADGPLAPVQLFLAVQDLEATPFMGDLAFWWHLERLAGGSQPLLRLADGGAFVAPRPAREEDGTPLFDGPALELTQTGADVLAGRLDWATLSPPDRWLGGVHLALGAPLWRWDPGTEKLVAPGSD